MEAGTSLVDMSPAIQLIPKMVFACVHDLVLPFFEGKFCGGSMTSWTLDDIYASFSKFS